MEIDLSVYKNELSFKNQLLRFSWNITWLLLARPFPRRFGNRWKIRLLRIFGAKIHPTATVYSSVRIYMPWKLKMGEYSCLAPEVDCYNVDWIEIGAHTIISQKSYLCTASHDIRKIAFPLVTSPIRINDQVWVAAGAFIGPGVEIGQGAIVAACSVVIRNVSEWTMVGGNPAVQIGKREIQE
jgi:putative colanic acid biosynthesis acetyltransferase WcaF